MDSERPTLVPEFDVEAFAHDSETKLAASPRTAPSTQSGIPGIDSATTLEEIRALYTAGKYEDALERAERLLQLAPLHAEAGTLATKCKVAIEEALIKRLGGLRRVPAVAARPQVVNELGLDAHEGFILSQIDGKSDVETLLDICSMPRLVVLRIIEHLAGSGIIVLRRVSGQTPR